MSEHFKGDWARDDYRNGYGGYYTRDEHSFRGRGPKNYRRSDERIREEVNERLTDHPRIDATDIEVQVENGEVTLDGTVADRNQKRLAEDIADDCRGVIDVHNRLRMHIGKATE